MSHMREMWQKLHTFPNTKCLSVLYIFCLIVANILLTYVCQEEVSNIWVGKEKKNLEIEKVY